MQIFDGQEGPVFTEPHQHLLTHLEFWNFALRWFHPESQSQALPKNMINTDPKHHVIRPESHFGLARL